MRVSAWKAEAPTKIVLEKCVSRMWLLCDHHNVCSEIVSGEKMANSRFFFNCVHFCFHSLIASLPHIIFLSLHAIAIVMNAHEAIANPNPHSHFRVII